MFINLIVLLLMFFSLNAYGEQKEIEIKEIVVLSQRGTMMLLPVGIQDRSGGCPENTGNPYYFTGDIPANTSELTRLPMKNEMAFSIAMAAYLNGEKVTLDYTIPLDNRCVVNAIRVIKK